MRTHSGSASTAVCSTSRAVDSENITAPGGATDSIRCAIPTVLARRGVPERPGTELTGDHPTRIQTYPHSQSHAIAAMYIGRQPLGFLLDRQGGEAGAKGVILQRNRGAEQRHHAVAVVLHGPAEAAHHRRRPFHQLGHDLAQPLRCPARPRCPSTGPHRRTAPSPACTPPRRPTRSAATRTRHRIGRPREARHHTTGTLPALPSPHPPPIPRPRLLPDQPGYGFSGLIKGVSARGVAVTCRPCPIGVAKHGRPLSIRRRGAHYRSRGRCRLGETSGSSRSRPTK